MFLFLRFPFMGFYYSDTCHSLCFILFLRRRKCSRRYHGFIKGNSPHIAHRQCKACFLCKRTYRFPRPFSRFALSHYFYRIGCSLLERNDSSGSIFARSKVENGIISLDRERKSNVEGSVMKNNKIKTLAALALAAIILTQPISAISSSFSVPCSDKNTLPYDSKNVIFLHGLGQDSSSWNETFQFLDFNEKESINIIDDAMMEPSFSDLKKNVEAQLAQKEGPFILCGLSLGAVLAIAMSLDCP